MTLKTILHKSKPYILLAIKSALGGLAIVLGTIASKLCPYPILAPLLFATGIGLVMAFDLGLITRYTPTAPKFKIVDSLIILAVNLAVAYIAGLFAPFSPVLPDHLFLMSIAGGAVIGLVSWNNIVPSPYKVPLFLLLMYIFVMLGLPHVVVLSFLNASPVDLLIVGAGNIVGGLLVRGAIFAKSFDKTQ